MRLESTCASVWRTTPDAPHVPGRPRHVLADEPKKPRTVALLDFEALPGFQRTIVRDFGEKARRTQRQCRALLRFATLPGPRPKAKLRIVEPSRLTLAIWMPPVSAATPVLGRFKLQKRPLIRSASFYFDPHGKGAIDQDDPSSWPGNGGNLKDTEHFTMKYFQAQSGPRRHRGRGSPKTAGMTPDKGLRESNSSDSWGLFHRTTAQ